MIVRAGQENVKEIRAQRAIRLTRSLILMRARVLESSVLIVGDIRLEEQPNHLWEGFFKSHFGFIDGLD